MIFNNLTQMARVKPADGATAQVKSVSGGAWSEYIFRENQPSLVADGADIVASTVRGRETLDRWVRETAQSTGGGDGNVATQTHAATEKTPPVNADELPLADSAASWGLKKLTFANLFLWIVSKVAALSSKATPVDADSVLLIDSEASNVGKRLTLTNLKAFLKTYFDTLYMSITGPTYITQQATATRVTGSAPDALGEYRSYLRNAAARTYTETNGSPTTAPSSTNGYKLYNGNAFASADTNNEPSKYEIYIGTGKTPIFEFYKNTGRTGLISTDIFPNWAGTNDVGCATGYDPVTGVAFVTIIQNGKQCAPGVDEDGVAVVADIYFDIKC